MTTLNLQNTTCLPSLKLLGDFWTLRIIDALSAEELRFCELQRSAGMVNPVTLTTRLKKLESAKLIDRRQESRSDVHYGLTDLGKEILPVLDAVNRFSEAAKAIA